MSFEINFTKTYSDEEISDILFLAIYGGIGYWARLCNDTPEWKALSKPNSSYEEIMLELLLSRNCVEFDCNTEYDATKDLDGATGEPNNHWKLTKEKLEKGLTLYLSNDGTINTENMDAIDGDLIVQYSIFGEVIFG